MCKEKGKTGIAKKKKKSEGTYCKKVRTDLVI